MRVLLTGMSAVGKSTLVEELRARGWTAFDADDDGYSEPRPHGRWGWRVDLVTRLFEQHQEGVLFFAGCSEEQAQISFDLKVLLTVPEDVLLDRLSTRSSNNFGKTREQRALILDDRREIEPLLRASADLVIDATLPVSRVADIVLREVDTALGQAQEN